MRPDNTVCRARIIVTLDLPGGVGHGTADPAGLLRDLAAARARIDRTEAVVRALADAVPDLQVRHTRRMVELSTYAAELGRVETILRAAGALPREYRVDVEYSRMWGMV
ncbi:hypothetical protein [Raineyella sp. LH-20]|uniref:hypothetical protein n=1 Tax=Raineyella sp. LH-20 TaxID=3081204 RepID=UPI0029558428|nr:hypothetical protein [Raineyella sp. LH-20]WOP18156.1 hypothetical protein R0146_13110 [Raineyella sp. LH-20]